MKWVNQLLLSTPVTLCSCNVVTTCNIPPWPRSNYSKWTCICIACSDHSKCFTLHVSIHPFTHIFLHWWQGANLLIRIYPILILTHTRHSFCSLGFSILPKDTSELNWRSSDWWTTSSSYDSQPPETIKTPTTKQNILFFSYFCLFLPVTVSV